MSEGTKITIPKTAIEIQKMKLEKLMMNPDKPVVIPERPKEKKNLSVPEFVRNVMGSSAGAGSGEFHVYRHLRRKEYSRQKMIEELAQKEEQDRSFMQTLEESRKQIEEKTAKKRAKRLKRKEKLKQKRNLKKVKKEDNADVKSELVESSSNESGSDLDEEKNSDQRSGGSGASDSESKPES